MGTQGLLTPFTPETRLYLEQVAGMAGLEGDQRDAVLREITAKLSADVADREQAPQDRHAAEAAAIAQMGSPAAVADRYKPGGGWLIPILHVAGLFPFLYFAAMFTISGADVNLPPYILHGAAALMAFAGVAASLYGNRVSVTPDGLHIYRFLRRTKVVPFNAVTRVQANPVFMGQYLEIQYGQDKAASLNRKKRNFHWAVAALWARLDRDRFSGDAVTYIQRVQACPAGVRMRTRLIKMAVFLLLGALMLVDFHYAWNNLGLPLLLGVGLIAVTLMSARQTGTARERLRQAGFAITAAVAFYTVRMGVGQLINNVDVRGVLMMSLLTAVVAAILSLWRIRSTWAVVVFLIAYLVGSYMVLYHFPRPYTARVESLGIADLHPSGMMWLPAAEAEPQPAALLLGNQASDKRDEGGVAVAALFRPDRAVEVPLDDAIWDIVGPDSKGGALLMRTHTHAAADGTTRVVQYYTMDTNGALHEDIMATNINASLGRFLPGRPGISPSGRYILAGAEASLNLVLLDRETSQRLEFSDVTATHALRWKDDDTLALGIRESTGPKEEPSGKITLAEFHVESGTTSVTGQLDIGPGYAIRHLADNGVALIVKDMEWALASMDGTTSTALPFRLANSNFGFDYTRGRVAYVAALDDGAALVYAGLEGGIAQHPVSMREQFPIMEISPDGARVLLYRISNAQYVLPIGRRLIWDTKENTLGDIGGDPMIATMLKKLAGYAMQFPVSQWTPDGAGIGWPVLTYEGIQGLPATRFDMLRP